jgi:dienelactone hydrolase
MPERNVQIPVGDIKMEGIINVPQNAIALVIFVHGSGSSRFSPRNKMVAERLNNVGLATLLFDLLTEEEELIDDQNAQFRFDIGLITNRLDAVIDWVIRELSLVNLNIGLFGASTGAAAAIRSAVDMGEFIYAVVSRGGRPDLAGDDYLKDLKKPTLLIVGGLDEEVIDINKAALAKVPEISKSRIEIIPDATHLFEEEGKLEDVAELALAWFLDNLPELSYEEKKVI